MSVRTRLSADRGRLPAGSAVLALLLALPLALAAACGDGDTGGERAAAESAAPAPATSQDPGDRASPSAGPHGDEGVITLTPEAFAAAGVRTEVVATGRADAVAGTLDVPGTVEIDPRREVVVSSRVAGRLERLRAIEGERVRSGQTVAWVFSPAFLTAQQDLAQAVARARALAGTEDASGAEALAAAARRRLLLLGAGAALVERVADGGAPEDLLALAAPIGGTVMEARVVPGQALDVGAPVVRLADLSELDVVAQVPERALPKVRIGQRASVGIAAFPGLTFAGRVERLRGGLDPETRTVQAVLHVPNVGGRLRPGMYAAVRLEAPPGEAAGTAGGEAGPEAGGALTIPEAAVVTEGSGRIVFVERAPRTYERRVVEVASLTPIGSRVPTSGRVLVRSGLQAGERVVVAGAFTLKSELAKSELGEHGH